VGDVARRPQLLDHEAPARRRLKRRFHLLSLELAQEAAEADPVSGANATARDLAGVGVQPLGGDLCSVLVESHHYDCHWGLLMLRH
jgi:hypothetical protein